MRKMWSENWGMEVMNKRVFGRDITEESDGSMLALMNLNWKVECEAWMWAYGRKSETSWRKLKVIKNKTKSSKNEILN